MTPSGPQITLAQATPHFWIWNLCQHLFRIEPNFRINYEAAVCDRPSHPLGFLIFGAHQVMPARILTHSRAPFITFKLQPAGLLLTISARCQRKAWGGGGGDEHVRFVIKLHLSKIYNPTVY